MAIAYISYQTGGAAGGGFWGAVAGGATAGFLSSSGNIQGAEYGALEGGIMYGLGSAFEVNGQPPSGWALLGRSVAEGAAGGLFSEAGGGRFGDGFLGAFTASGSDAWLDSQIPLDGTQASVAERVTIKAILGGTLASVGGGDFANGAESAGFQELFNDSAHIVEQHEVTVYEPDGQDGNVFNHITISVDGEIAVGFDPVKDLSTSQVVEEFVNSNVSTGGIVQPDKNQKILDEVTLKITKVQAQHMQNYVNEVAAHPGDYQEKQRNCAIFAEDVLRAGGINVQTAYLPNHLMAELHTYYQQHQPTFTPAPALP